MFKKQKKKGGVPKMENPPPPPERKKPRLLKIWFNPERNFYEAFMPDGTPLPMLCEISVTDSIYGHDPEAVINAPVEVVNEKPIDKNRIEMTIDCSEVNKAINDLKNRLKQLDEIIYIQTKVGEIKIVPKEERAH